MFQNYWIVRRGSNYIIEVKCKEKYNAPPFDYLEQTKYFDTTNKIRIYNLKIFTKGGTFDVSAIKDVPS